jgi:hypothetical protein
MQGQSYELQILDLLRQNIQVKPMLSNFGKKHFITNMSILPAENAGTYKAIFNVSQDSYTKLKFYSSNANQLLQRFNFYIGNIKIKNYVKKFQFTKLNNSYGIADLTFKDNTKLAIHDIFRLNGTLTNYILDYKVTDINDSIKCWCQASNTQQTLPNTIILDNPDLYIWRAYNNGFNKVHTLEFLPIENDIYKIAITFTPSTLMPTDITLIDFTNAYIFEDDFYCVSNIDSFPKKTNRFININPLNTSQTFNKSANNNTQAFSNNTNIYNSCKASIYNIVLEVYFNDENIVVDDVLQTFNNQTNTMSSYYQAVLDTEIRGSLSVVPLKPPLSENTQMSHNCYLANIIRSAFTDVTSEKHPLSFAFTIEVLEDMVFSTAKYHNDTEGYKIESITPNGLFNIF